MKAFVNAERRQMKRKLKKMLALGTALAMIAGLCAGTALAADEDESTSELSTYSGQLGSLSADDSSGHAELSEDDVIYTVGIFVDADGINEDYSNISAIVSSSEDISDDAAVGLVVNDSTAGHNAVLVTNHDYTISGATIILDTDSDGTYVNDFTGRGSAVAVFGDSNVTITDSYIETTGVGTMPVFADSSTDDEGNTLSPVVTIKNSTLISNGGTIYQSYSNQFGADLMVAPPWVLGIMGTARCTNLEGTQSTMNVIDSTTASGAWAVLSTDMPDGVYLNVVNTSLTLLNSDESAAAPIQESGGQITTVDNPYTVNYGTGYGTYANGGTEAQTYFYGCEINVGTYAAIFTGGNITFTSLTPGESIELLAATGDEEDTVIYTYEGDEVKNTVINSDTFGFMFHESVNTAVITSGTEINSGYATFLVKAGKSGVVEEGESSNTVQSTVTVDGALITNGGVLIQVMDDDDSSTGNETENFKYFITTHTEQEGFADSNSETADGRTQDFTFTNGTYTGNIYNASGSDRSENDAYDVATTLNVTLGEGAVLEGAVATTTAIHVTYEGSVAIKEAGGYAFEDAEEAAEFAAEYQNTEFTISEYYDIGQVANMISGTEGANDINMTLTDDAVWYVTGTSVIDSLTISGSASVVVEEGSTLTVGTTVYEAGTYDAETFAADADSDVSEESEAAEVGDASNLALWTALGLLAVLGLIGAGLRKRITG